MRGPSVILAKQNAALIARRRPDALVLDHSGFRVLRGCESIVLGSRSGRAQLHAGLGRTQFFSVFAAVAGTADGLLSHETLFEALYGDPFDGGPAYPVNIMIQRLLQLRPVFEWAGLQVVTRKGFGAFECVWTGRGSALAVPARLDKAGRLHALAPRVCAPMLEAAE